METITLTETSRLIVDYDTDAENPLTWGSHMTESDETYGRWASGEVFTVTLERSKVYTADDGDTVTIWSYVESLGGCYLDDNYTAQVVAREHFTLTEDEAAATETTGE